LSSGVIVASQDEIVCEAPRAVLHSALPFQDSLPTGDCGEADMDSIYDDRFLVYVRADIAQCNDPEINEEPLAICDSYADARRVKQGVRNCVIRYAGSTGGGD
jgi:hypothetical protein